MLTENSIHHFDELWKLFDRTVLDIGGSMFLVDPFKEYFPQSFVNSLNAEDARTLLHRKMTKWGDLEQLEHEIEVYHEHKFEDGQVARLTRFKEPEIRSSRGFILSAFYNLCCLAANKQTIEELVFLANTDSDSIPMSESSRNAFMKLVALSNSFLLAEWAQNQIHRAVSNSDEEFFKALSKNLKMNTAVEKFPVARSWLGTILLWYLGGKDLKRRDFMLLLRKKDVIADSLQEPSFNAMLSKLKLIK